MRLLFCLMMGFGAVAVATPADAQPAKPGLLIDQAGLFTLWSDSKPVVVLDVRPRQQFDAGRVPSAQHIDIGAWKAAFGAGADAAGWGKRLGALGIDAETTVVVYDRFTSPSACRAWWLLKYWGVADARVLDGGTVAWKAAKAPPAADRPPTTFRATPQPDRLATRDEVLQAIAADSAGSACLIDTRTDAEWAAGVIPTAKHSDWLNYVDQRTGKLRPAAELERLLASAGYRAGVELDAITYCRSGGRAAVVAFVAELITGRPAANYWGSWNEWSQTPAVPSVQPVAAP